MLAGCNREKRNRFVIPEDYAGWLCVSYGVRGAQELPTEDGYRLIAFPPGGVVETSTLGIPGAGYVDEYLSGDKGRREMDIARELGGGYTESGAQPGKYTHKFWVSRNARADHAKYVQGQDDRCGPFANYEPGEP
jgi:hypothetical protein